MPRAKRREPSVKTGVKSVLIKWRKTSLQKRNNSLRPKIARLQELYNLMKPLHMSRRRKVLDAEGLAKLETLEKEAKQILAVVTGENLK